MINDDPAFLPQTRKARVEIIPLIDVVFFLLATFVLFTLSLNKTLSLEALFPKGGDPGEYRDVTLQASAPGTCYWKLGDQPAELIGVGELRGRLADYKHRAADPKVIIRGDNQATLGSTVRVLDEVRLAGISQICVETQLSRPAN